MYNYRRAPNTIEELHHLVYSLRRHGLMDPTIFQYPCPECRAIVLSTPVEVIMMKALRAEVEAIVGDSPLVELDGHHSCGSGQSNANYFSGLFLTFDMQSII